MKRLPLRLQHQVKALLDGTFVDLRENILAFGNPGIGKTHLLCALGLVLVHKNRRVLSTTCSLLVQELLKAKRDLEFEKVLKRLSRFDVIIIDDFGYVQQEQEEMGNEVTPGTLRIGGFSGGGSPIAKNSQGAITQVRPKVTGTNYVNGQKSQICIGQYTDDLSGFQPVPACATFILKK